MSDDFRLTVLNPGGRDAAQTFAEGAGAVEDGLHAPVNFHAYAACTRGAFARETAAILPEQRAVLVLLRRDLKPGLRAVQSLRERGHVVAISWKESGLHQVAAQLAEPKALTLFQEICAAAHGALSCTEDLVPTYAAAGARVVTFIPTPYPVDDARWDFGLPASERAGVFIGTREFGVPSRNHLAALLSAKQLNMPVTVFNDDGRAGAKRLAALGIGELRVLEQRLPYAAYLREMARHRLVLQCDQSSVPGQVAGDALLARVPLVGGNGAIERVAFPATCGHGRSVQDCLEIAERLLADEPLAERVMADALERADAALSFEAGEEELAAFFQQLGG